MGEHLNQLGSQPSLVGDRRDGSFDQPEGVALLQGPPALPPERQFERLILSLRPDDLLAAEPQLAQLTVPTLIAWATHDVFFDLSWAYWLKNLIPGATEVTEIDGHLFFPEERPGDLIDALRKHWDQ